MYVNQPTKQLFNCVKKKKVSWMTYITSLMNSLKCRWLQSFIAAPAHAFRKMANLSIWPYTLRNQWGTNSILTWAKISFQIKVRKWKMQNIITYYQDKTTIIFGHVMRCNCLVKVMTTEKIKGIKLTKGDNFGWDGRVTWKATSGWAYREHKGLLSVGETDYMDTSEWHMMMMKRCSINITY